MNNNLSLKIDAYYEEYIEIHDITKYLIPDKTISEFTEKDIHKIFELWITKEIFVIKNVWENFYYQGTLIFVEMEEDISIYKDEDKYTIFERHEPLSFLYESLKAQEKQDVNGNRIILANIRYAVEWKMKVIDYFINKYGILK